MRKAVVVLASARPQSNSTAIAQQLAAGFAAAGGQVTTLRLHEMQFGPCKGCFGCRKQERCVLQDDMQGAVEAVAQAEVLVLTAPVFMHQVPGQVKIFMDRLYPLLQGEPGHYSLRYGKKAFVPIYTQGAPHAAAFSTMMDLVVTAMDGMGLHTVERIVFPGANPPGRAEQDAVLLSRVYALGQRLAME